MDNKEYYDGHKIFLTSHYPSIWKAELNNGKGGIVYVHRLVAEKTLGRFLTKNEVVHHVDGNPQNYDSNNIWVFRSKADHVAFHAGAPYHKGDDGVYFCDKIINPNNDDSDDSLILSYQEKRVCIDCGKPISKGAIRCLSCASKKSQAKKSKKPTKDILCNLLETHNLSEIGRMYSVSANAVKKWCISYNIEYNPYFPAMPPRDGFLINARKYTYRELAEMYHTSVTTVSNWLKKLDINIPDRNLVLCITTNNIYKTAQEAAKSVYPKYDIDAAAYRITTCCKNGSSWNGFAWAFISPVTMAHNDLI